MVRHSCYLHSGVPLELDLLNGCLQARKAASSRASPSWIVAATVLEKTLCTVVTFTYGCFCRTSVSGLSFTLPHLVHFIARPLTVVVGHSSFTMPWSWSPDLSHASAAMVSAVGNMQLLRLLLHCFSLPYLLLAFSEVSLASIYSRSDTVVSRMPTTIRSLSISSFRVPYSQLSIRPYRVVM